MQHSSILFNPLSLLFIPSRLLIARRTLQVTPIKQLILHHPMPRPTLQHPPALIHQGTKPALKPVIDFIERLTSTNIDFLPRHKPSITRDGLVLLELCDSKDRGKDLRRCACTMGRGLSRTWKVWRGRSASGYRSGMREVCLGELRTW